MHIKILLLAYFTFVLNAQDPLTAPDVQLSPNGLTKADKLVGCKSILPGFYGTQDCLANFLKDQTYIKGTPNFALVGTFR